MVNDFWSFQVFVGKKRIIRLFYLYMGGLIQKLVFKSGS
jgi:hypothetical protein